MIDPVDEAVKYWDEGGASMFDFCIQAAYIVGRRQDGETKRLGEKIKRSPDTVEDYAKAGLLWHAICQKYPADSELMREALDYHYWRSIGVLWNKNIMSLDGAWHWLNEAMIHNIKFEKFCSMLPTKKALDSDWQKSAWKTAVAIDDLCKSPAFGVDDVRYRAGIKILQIASIWLKGMTMKNVIELIMAEKIADNGFRAAAIANGCQLSALKTDEERLARVRLYRDWRNSGIYGKQTQPCFDKAIAGEAVPVMPMFDEVMHSDITRAAEHHTTEAQ
jgi:hypothetical protein